MFAYAIIGTEILSWKGPYGCTYSSHDLGLKCNQLINSVKSYNLPELGLPTDVPLDLKFFLHELRKPLKMIDGSR